MQLSMTYWLIAWGTMLLAFVTASGAILIGAKRLDENAEKETKNRNMD